MTSMDKVVKQIKEQEQLEKERNEMILKLEKIWCRFNQCLMCIQVGVKRFQMLNF